MSTHAPSPPPARAATASPPLVIGEGVRITGNIECAGDLRIDGMVEGDVRARTIVVGPGGIILGTLAGEEVLILGAVTGIVYGCGVTLGPTASVTGDLVHETLCIEAGAIFAGACRRPTTANPAKPIPRRPALLAAPAGEDAPAPKEPLAAE